MSQDFEPLEQELRRLRPRALSFETEMGIEDRLGRARRSTALGELALPMLFGIGVVCLCAGVAAVMILGQRFEQAAVIAGEPRPEQNGVVQKSMPTLAAYRRAFATSSEAFEALLDRPAAGLRNGAAVPWGRALRGHAELPF